MTSQETSSPGSVRGPGSLGDDTGAVVAGVVIETQPGQGPFVACRLGDFPDLEIVGGDGDRRLAAVWCATSGKALEKAVEALLRGDPDILGIFPTFIGRDEDGVDSLEARDDALRAMIPERDDEVGGQ